ncbi:MAG TPA: MFS transporter [Candidatus Acidoferrales bacterium]|nr:MFS transporter [Candidatus Acidoferrales bacterium]
MAALTLGPNYLHGMYEVVWSLFMRGIGASSFQIGASFSLFALPYVLLVPAAGRLADRYDRRWLAAASTAGAGLLAAVYPYLPGIPLVIAFCALEGAVVVFGIPAKNAFLMDAVPADRRGQVQGLIGAGSGLAAALAALVAGPQFQVAVPLAFFFAATVDLVLVLVALPLLAAAGAAERVPA